jgi:hypothetical protein
MTEETQESTRFEMRSSPEWLGKVDKWREEQTDSPSRAEAIRRLVNIALANSPHAKNLEPLRDDGLKQGGDRKKGAKAENPWKLKYSAFGEDDPNEICRAVGHALSTWEGLEEAFALSFGHFVGSKHVVALRAIGRVESPVARLNVVLEAYRASSDDERAKYPTFEAIIKEAMKASEIRNALAHGYVKWAEVGERKRVYFLTPTLSTTRKTVQIDRIDQERLINAPNETEALKALHDYALNAKDIDAYRAEFTRLRAAVWEMEFPSAKFFIPG